MTKNTDPTPDSVASPADNAKLEHTAGGKTTRDDPLDAGVPMVQGDPREPIGPEDALGPGPTRGDYSGRIDAGPHLVSEPIPASEREPGGPTARLVDAAARTAEVGDAPGKGGVPGTAPREDLDLPEAPKAAKAS